MALCDTEFRNQVKALLEYKDIDKKLDLMTLLKAIKRIVYTSGSENLHAKHNNAMAHISFFMCLKKKNSKTFKISGTSTWPNRRYVLNWANIRSK